MSWTKKNNWDLDTAPSANDELVFGGTAKLTTNNNDFNANTSFNSITFNNTAGAFTLSGNAITLGAGGVTNNDLDTQTINLDMILSGTRTFNAAFGDLVVGGDTAGAISGSGHGIIKEGGSTLTLNRTNAYSGTTTINNGTLALGASGSIANSSQISIAGGATLNVSSVLGGWTLGSAQTLTGSGTVVGATTVNGTLAPTAAASGDPLAFGSTLAFNTGSTDIFSWSLNATTTDPGQDAVNQGTYGQVAVTGAVSGTSVFNVVLGSNTFADAFWNTDKSWSNIFSALGLTDLATVFTSFGGTGIVSGIVEGQLRGTVADQGYFTFSGTTLNYTAIPEPTTALAGLLLTAGLLRRRRQGDASQGRRRV